MFQTKMNEKLVFAAASCLFLAVLISGQDKPRLGSDGRPLLNKPKVEMCKNRTYHEKYGNHHYFLSWREPWNKFEVILKFLFRQTFVLQDGIWDNFDLLVIFY